MATDKSEPRVVLIMKIAVFAILALVVIRTALVSYFDKVARAEEQRKVGDLKPEALMNVRADERARLSAGAMPIDKAMHDVAAHGRMAASPDIMPSASRDLAPLAGWSQMPADVPSAMAAPEPQPAPVGSSSVDGGAAGTAVDGGLRRHERARPDGDAGLHASPRLPQ